MRQEQEVYVPYKHMRIWLQLLLPDMWYVKIGLLLRFLTRKAFLTGR